MAEILLFITILGVALCAIGSIVVWSIKNGISPMPSSRKAKRCLLQNLPEIRNGKVYELGSGWGTLAFPLAKKLSRYEIVGYENSPIPFFVSKLLHLFMRLPNLKLFHQDFYQATLTDASLIICYLYPGAMKNLKDKFEKELKPGTLIISNTFAIHGWKPFRVEEVADIYRTKIYFYRKNAAIWNFLFRLLRS